MAMVVKNNMAAVSTLNTLNRNSGALQKSLAKVSSGMKINSAQDDASGYAISERMRVQIRALDQANQNTQNASSLMKTAEGAVSSTVEILKTLKEKAINAATDTNTDADRKTIQKEVNQFIDQIDDNALVTFNGKYLVEGSKAQAGSATKTAFTSQAFGLKDTQGNDLDGTTALTDLTNRKGEGLEISTSDKITASFVKDGQTYYTTFKVGTTNTLNDVFKNLNGLITGGVFGEPNLTPPADPPTADEVTAAQGVLTDATLMSSANLLTAAQDNATTDANAKKIIDAVKVLVADSANSATNLAASTSVTSVDTVSDAETALKSALGDVYDNLKVKFKNDHGSDGISTAGTLDADVRYMAYGEDGTLGAAETIVSITGENPSANISPGGTEAVGVPPADKDDFVSKMFTSIKNMATALMSGATVNEKDGTTQITSIEQGIKAALDTLSVTNVSATKDGTANIAASGTLDKSGANLYDAHVEKAESSAGAGDGITAASDYAKAVAYDKIVENNTPGAAGATTDFVSSSSDIGLAASGAMTSTADGEIGLTVTALNEGLAGQISGLTISVADSEGNVRKTVNEFMNSFTTSIFAANQSDDLSLKLHVGAQANQSISVGLQDMRSEALGLKGSDGSIIDVSTQPRANAAIAAFDNAIQKALDQQTTIGAIEARLEYTSSNLTTSAENTQAAESAIRDADMAKEMTNYTKNNVLLQAAQSMLAQANQNSSAVLSLLQ